MEKKTIEPAKALYNDLPKPTEYCSVHFLANLFDISSRRVQQLAVQGVTPKVERGKYHLVSSVKGYCSYLKHNRTYKGSHLDAFMEEKNCRPGFQVNEYENEICEEFEGQYIEALRELDQLEISED